MTAATRQIKFKNDKNGCLAMTLLVVGAMALGVLMLAVMGWVIMVVGNFILVQLGSTFVIDYPLGFAMAIAIWVVGRLLR